MKLSRYIKILFLLVIFTGSFSIKAKASGIKFTKYKHEEVLKAKSSSNQENNSNQTPAEENKEEKDNENETDDENESEVGGKHRQNTSELFVCHTLLGDYLDFFSYSQKLNYSAISCKFAAKELIPIYISVHSIRI